MTVTGDGSGAATSPLAASAGLTDADLLEMYRTVALARAVDERMWILNRAGRAPFVISGQGHEGAQIGLAWALRLGVISALSRNGWTDFNYSWDQYVKLSAIPYTPPATTPAASPNASPSA